MQLSHDIASRIFSTAIIIIAAFVLVTYGSGLLKTAFDGSSPADFPNYYFAGRRLINSEPIYVDLAAEVKSGLGWEYTVYPADPPFTVALLSPLAMLPYRTAWLTLAAISVLAMAVGCFAAARAVEQPVHFAAMCAALGVISVPFLFLLKRNHMETLVLLASVGGWLLLRRGRNVAGMALWGLGAAMKLFPALWIVLAWRQCGRRAFAAGLWSAMIFSFAGMAAVGSGNTLYFITEIIPRSSMWYGTVGNYSLLSLGSALAAPWLGWTLAAGAVLLICRPQLWNTGSIDEVWLKAICLSLLLTPLAWLNYFVLIIPGLIALGTKIDRRSLARRSVFYVLVVMTCFWPTDLILPNRLATILVGHAPTVGLLGIIFLYDWITSSVITVEM
jgi:hypothetical protein